MMNTTTARVMSRKHLEPVLEELIIRELMREMAPLQQSEAQFADFIPALIALLAGQPQQLPIQQPGSPLVTLLPTLTALLAGQPQRVPVQQPGSPLATLLPILTALLAGQQPPVEPSPLESALLAALAPTITSAITGRPRDRFAKEEQREAGEEKQPEMKQEEETREGEAGEGPERAGQ